ncbi:hypothetical protein D1B31_15250 [Neobacillus notoginsengisoli]|uniref:DUF4830 domain-containing protein n=1 Tax=Neobacillus notoginsengisoli TaxID=1578198 RepID=A0A417YS67_9BACI|nr:hypothetical protein [Neobacillus notoginsengisoli]RHW38131.1 hypothetical protein D1B31_15250 [Neobacillus notoginsengisoli]
MKKPVSSVKISLFFLFFFLLTGCVLGTKLDANAKLAKEHLLKQGYSVTSYKGSRIYKFERQDLVELPHKSIWTLQSVKPDEFIGKELVEERFIVKNHPVGKIYKSKVMINVYIYDGEVIGGTSYPAVDGLVGWGYSLDGKTAEELRGNDFQKWSAEWNETYGE